MHAHGSMQRHSNVTINPWFLLHPLAASSQEWWLIWWYVLSLHPRPLVAALIRVVFLSTSICARFLCRLLGLFPASIWPNLVRCFLQYHSDCEASIIVVLWARYYLP
jgi:hypothetical protein